MRVAKRFVPALRWLWLACRRAGCNRDMRNLVVNGYVAKRLFGWESYELLDERIETQWVYWEKFDCPRFPPFADEFKHAVEVMDWDAQIGHNVGLRLHRVKLRFHKPGWFWMWLRK